MNTRFADMEGSEYIHEYSRGMGNPANVFMQTYWIYRWVPTEYIRALCIYSRREPFEKSLPVYGETVRPLE
jgi:hypothetical protein